MEYDGTVYETEDLGDSIRVTITEGDKTYSNVVAKVGYLDVVGGVEGYLARTGIADAALHFDPPPPWTPPDPLAEKKAALKEALIAAGQTEAGADALVNVLVTE